MQSIPVSPPPTTITRLPAAVSSVPGAGGFDGPPLLRGDPAVALIEVVHREMDSRELPARGDQVARDARADRDHERVIALAQLGGGDVAPDVGVVDELDPLLLEDRDPPIDDPLLELGVGHAESQQPPGSLVALVHA